MSRDIQFVPKSPTDRKIDRETWKYLDRALRTIWRKHEKEMAKAFEDALIYGTGVVHGLPMTFKASPIDLGGDK